VRTEKLTEAMQKLGMKEGLDVALEMSGNPKAFADMFPKKILIQMSTSITLFRFLTVNPTWKNVS